MKISPGSQKFAFSLYLSFFLLTHFRNIINMVDHIVCSIHNSIIIFVMKRNFIRRWSTRTCCHKTICPPIYIQIHNRRHGVKYDTSRIIIIFGIFVIQSVIYSHRRSSSQYRTFPYIRTGYTITWSSVKQIRITPGKSGDHCHSHQNGSYIFDYSFHVL